MIAIFNILIILIIILGGVIGYINGFKKSIFKLLSFILLLIIGWLVSPIFGKLLVLTNFKSVIINIISKFYVNIYTLTAYQTYTNLIIEEFIIIIGRLIFVILFVILGLLLSLIYKRLINDYFKKYLITIKSKIIGMFVGIIQSLLFAFLICVFISGVSSIKRSISLLTNENISLVNYRNSYIGQMLINIKLESTPIDEFAFDQIFTIDNIKIRKEIETISLIYNKYSVHFNEINFERFINLDNDTFLTLLNDIKRLNSNKYLLGILLEFMVVESDLDEKGELFNKIKNINFNQDLLFFEMAYINSTNLRLFDDNDLDYYFNLNQDEVIEFIFNISNIESVNVLGEFLRWYLINNIFTEEFTIKLDNIEWTKEIKNIALVYQTYYKLGINSSKLKEIDFGKISDEDLIVLADAIFNSKIINDNSLDIAKLILKNSPKQIQDSIKFDQIEHNDFINILLFGKILFACGLLDEVGELDDFLKIENIEKIAEYISTSKIMSKNISGILKIFFIGFKFPEDFVLEIPPHIDWYSEEGKKEIINLFVKFNELNIKIKNQEELITNFETLSYIIYDSEVLVYNIDNILSFIINRYIGDVVYIEIGEYEWTAIESQNELKAFIGGLCALLRSDIINNPDISDLSDDEIKHLSDKLAASEIIRKNMSTLLIDLTTGITSDFKLAVFDDYNLWTSDEIYYLFSSIKIIQNLKNFPNDLFTLEIFELDMILLSKVMVETIIMVLIDSAASGLVIRYDSVDENWFDRDNQSGELRNFLYGLHYVFKYSQNNFPDINPNVLLMLTEDEIEEILKSMIICDTFIYFLYDLGQEGALVVNIELYEERWYGIDGELRRFIEAIKIILGDEPDLVNLDINPNFLKNITTGDVGENGDDLTIIFESIIATDTLIQKIKDLETIEITPGTKFVIDIYDEDWYDSPSGKPGELRHFIRGLQIIFRDSDLSNPNIDPEFILNLSDGTEDTNGDGIIDANDCNQLGTVLKSKIISDSIIRIIIDKIKNQQN